MFNNEHINELAHERQQSLQAWAHAQSLAKQAGRLDRTTAAVDEQRLPLLRRLALRLVPVAHRPAMPKPSADPCP